MLCDLGQDGAKVELRIEAVELGRPDKAVHGGGPFSTAVGICEQIVLASKSYDTQDPCGRAVIYLQQPVVGATRKGTPARERIPNGARSFTLR